MGGLAGWVGGLAGWRVGGLVGWCVCVGVCWCVLVLGKLMDFDILYVSYDHIFIFYMLFPRDLRHPRVVLEVPPRALG